MTEMLLCHRCHKPAGQKWINDKWVAPCTCPDGGIWSISAPHCSDPKALLKVPDDDQWPWHIRESIVATWKHTVSGPELYVAGVVARRWLGTYHDGECGALCAEINQAYIKSKNFGLMTQMDLWDIATYWHASSLLHEQWVQFNKSFFSGAGHQGCRGWSFAT